MSAPSPSPRPPGCRPRWRAAGKLETCDLVFLPRAAVGCVTCARFPDPGSETAPLWRGLRVLRGRWCQPQPRGPQSLHLSDGAAPARPPGGPDARWPLSALRRGLPGPGAHALGGLAHWARARDRQPGCPLKKGRWRRALSPRDRRCRESPRTCREQGTGLITGRGGKSGAGTWRAGRGRHPTCPRPAQVRPRGSAKEPAGRRGLFL